MNSDRKVLFEPWGLGDAIIAFSAALQRPNEFSLACQSRWHPVLRAGAVLQGLICPDLIAIDLTYVSRYNTHRATKRNRGSYGHKREVLSIRGDLRDYRAAKELFPGASITMGGWIAFAAKRSTLVDLPFSKGLLPVRNRYQAWAHLAEIPWSEVEAFYLKRQPFSGPPYTVIHAGAQWRSKQFPYVAELASLQRLVGKVTIIIGPGDPLPPDVAEHEVLRLADGALVEMLHACTHFIANDTGPMHVAAMLRRRTLAVANHLAMLEWLPPGVVLSEANGHRGHRATHTKPSDVSYSGWPPASELASLIKGMS